MLSGSLRSVVSLVAAAALLLGARTASADPSLGYIDAAYALPWHAAFASVVEDGHRQNEKEVGLRSDFGLGALSAGLGLGYTGLNGQLDFRNALHLTTGALTIGIREKLSLAGFELWVRAGIGPSLVFDANEKKVNTTGGIATDLEGGADYFVLPFLALGLKLVGAPQYTWPANFAVDFGLNAGIRLAI
jgi:hypothetical protein